MRPELQQLLARFDDNTKQPGSTQTVSWHAYEEARQLTDRSMVVELGAYVAAEKDHRRRDHAHYIIGWIGQNLGDPSCAEILITRLGRESNKYSLSHLLDSIGEIPKPAGMDLSPIYALFDDERWLVRRAAIKALWRAQSPEAERRLINHLQTSTDPDDIIQCQAALSDIGTPRAIPVMEPNLKSRKRDVRGSAEFAINAIRERHGAASARATS